MTPRDVEWFRVHAESMLGIALDVRHRTRHEGVLARRCEAYGLSASAYVAQLAASPGFDEAALATELTVGETYFFRNREQFAAFDEIARARETPLDVVSAGCASGEEAYSLAIVLREAQRAEGATIRAFDINPEALRRATRARYSTWSLRETSAEMRERWFHLIGKHVELAPVIRQAVEFRRANLVDATLWAAESLDVVFCRNVLMYFRPEVMANVVRAIAGALRPGGYLFLGHAESLRGIAAELDLCQSHGTFYYRRTTGLPASVVVRATVPRRVEPPEPTWVDSIAEASERVRTLVEPDGSAAEQACDAELRDDLFELWRNERYGDVLAAIDRRGDAGDPEVAVMYAAACAQCGRIEDVEQSCERLIAGAAAPAAGHFILALCCEGAGDLAGAIEHQRVAVRLDPGFALAHLRLGVLARRRNDRALASRELTQAAALLENEDERRIVLFGGGFPRDALIALCRSELANVERTS